MSKAVETIGTYIPDNLIADNIHPIDTKAVVLAAGTGTLARGTLVNSTGAMCSTSSDVPVGILTKDTELDASNTTPTVMYISGSFVADEIKVDASVSVTAFATALQNLGIFLK